MNKKGLAILMRTRMRPTNNNNTNHPHQSKLPLSPITQHKEVNEMVVGNSSSSSSSSNSQGNYQPLDDLDNARRLLPLTPDEATNNSNHSSCSLRNFDVVRESLHSAMSLNKDELLDAVLNDFQAGYLGLDFANRHKLLLTLAKVYDLNRLQVRDLIKQYLGLGLPGEAASGDESDTSSLDEDYIISTFYRIERNLRQVLKPPYAVLFDRLNTHPGGLEFLTILRADILSILEEDNVASLRSLDSYLKEKLNAWLSPASLELHRITWDDPASLLEKIVAYEAVHPISNLLDLKRRLGVCRRCFGYLHPAIPGEPLIFIEVALLKHVARTIQEVLWDNPPTPESQATCALFYSISSTKPGLAGINLGKFLIKRVITLVKRDMPHISTFATLSPIPGYMQWLLSKLAAQSMLAKVENMSTASVHGSDSDSTFFENLLEPYEEKLLLNAPKDKISGSSGMEVMLNLLTSANYGWTCSDELLSALKPPLMRLCARYLLQEKKRGKALDSVANFHLQNGAMIERINWMADRSEKGLRQSGGIMVNYVYRVENIEEYAQSYFGTGQIHASFDMHHYAMKDNINQGLKKHAEKKILLPVLSKLRTYDILSHVQRAADVLIDL